MRNMRNTIYFLTGLLCGALLWNGTAVLANSDVLAKITSQLFYLNGKQTALFAYNIGGNNYIKLRDATALFGADICYVEETNSVYISTDGTELPKESPLQEEPPKETVPVQPVQYIDGQPFSKEEYFAKANGRIFDEVYTKAAYNTMRQTVCDTKEIVAGNDQNGYSPSYTYAHHVDLDFTFETPSKTDEVTKSVASLLSGYYLYEFGAEPTLQNRYAYPGYRILTVRINPKFEQAGIATDSFVAGLLTLSDKDKVKRMADFISDRIIYKDENVAGINEIFTSQTPVNGICGTYAGAFMYLCQRADIPCVTVKDQTHAWNEVYLDGSWQTVDISYYDVARTDEALFSPNYPRTDPHIQKTEFAKELLVPNSTAHE